MGITVKVWPASDEDVRAMLATSELADRAFFQATTFTLVHDCKQAHGWLSDAAGRGILQSVPGTEDPTYAATSVVVRELAVCSDPGMTKLLAQSAHPMDVRALVQLAAAEGNALLFCWFEDW